MASLNLGRNFIFGNITPRLRILSGKSSTLACSNSMHSTAVRKDAKKSQAFANMLSPFLSPCVHRPFIATIRPMSDDKTNTDSQERVKKLVEKSKVVVFMKGIPDRPACGFSNMVVQILRMHGVKYDAHNVLEDDELRAAIKDFSNWPTIPQVYFKGEFIGGCDIVLDMHRSGDLIDELHKIGVRSALLDQPQE